MALELDGVVREMTIPQALVEAERRILPDADEGEGRVQLQGHAGNWEEQGAQCAAAAERDVAAARAGGVCSIRAQSEGMLLARLTEQSMTRLNYHCSVRLTRVLQHEIFTTTQKFAGIALDCWKCAEPYTVTLPAEGVENLF